MNRARAAWCLVAGSCLVLAGCRDGQPTGTGGTGQQQSAQESGRDRADNLTGREKGLERAGLDGGRGQDGRRDDRPAERLCGADVPTWIVHAEKGDGGLTGDERRTLERCPHVRLVTIPGTVFLLPNEVPARMADVTLEAMRHAA